MPRARTRNAAPAPQEPGTPMQVEASWDPATFPFDDEDLLLAIKTKHWPGTEEAAVVKTDAYLDGLRAVSHAATRRQLVCFHGEPGTGKTLTALSACQFLAIRPFYVPIAPARSGKDVEFQILSAIDPANAIPSATRYVMRKKIVDRLSAEPCLLVLDEYDLSEREGLDVLRFLLEQRRAKAGFVVVGSKAHRMLRSSPPLNSRCARWVAFGPQPKAALLPLLRAYHPLLAATADEVLLRVDREWAHGNLRDWAKFLEAALRVGAAPDRGVTREQIGLTYGLVGRPDEGGEL